VIKVQGLFAPRYFRSSERKFPLRTFAPGSESSRELSLPGAKVLGNFRSLERKFSGTFAPGNESSQELSFPSKQVRFLTTVIDIYNTQMLGAAVKKLRIFE